MYTRKFSNIGDLQKEIDVYESKHLAKFVKQSKTKYFGDESTFTFQILVKYPSTIGGLG